MTDAGRLAEIERDFAKAVTAAVEALAGLGMSADEIGEWLTGGIQSDALSDVAWDEDEDKRATQEDS